MRCAAWTCRSNRAACSASSDPNGSGKTTTLKLLLGLARADAGELRLLGRRVPDELPAVVGRVGALIETPLFLPGFSGRRNLGLLAGAAGIPASPGRGDAGVRRAVRPGR